MFMNKYQGRKLTLPGLKEALYQFFHDGQHLRGELLSPVLQRLHEMQAALEACESYRFYSSSLLIIYDGEPPRAHRADEDGLSDQEEDDDEEETSPGEEKSSGGGGAARRRLQEQRERLHGALALIELANNLSP